MAGSKMIVASGYDRRNEAVRLPGGRWVVGSVAWLPPVSNVASWEIPERAMGCFHGKV